MAETIPNLHAAVVNELESFADLLSSDLSGDADNTSPEAKQYAALVDNLISSLLSWSVDVRLDEWVLDNVLEALSNETAMSILDALYDLQQHFHELRLLASDPAQQRAKCIADAPSLARMITRLQRNVKPIRDTDKLYQSSQAWDLSDSGSDVSAYEATDKGTQQQHATLNRNESTAMSSGCHDNETLQEVERDKSVTSASGNAASETAEVPRTDEYGHVHITDGPRISPLQLIGFCLLGFHIFSSYERGASVLSALGYRWYLQEMRLIEWTRWAGIQGGDLALRRQLNANQMGAVLYEIFCTLFGPRIRSGEDDIRACSLLAEQLHSELSASKSNMPPIWDKMSIASGVHEPSARIDTRRMVTRLVGIDDSPLMEDYPSSFTGPLVGRIASTLNRLYELSGSDGIEDMMYHITKYLKHAVRSQTSYGLLESLGEALLKASLEAESEKETATYRSLAYCISTKVSLLSSSKTVAAVADLKHHRYVDLYKEVILSQLKLDDELSGRRGTYIAKNSKVLWERIRLFEDYEKYNHTSGLALQQQVHLRAQLLGSPAGAYMRFPQLQGFIEDGEEMVMLFQHPSPEAPKDPVTLRNILRGEVTKRLPTLAAKHRLAMQLITAMDRLHLAGWCHKAFRPENIVFFPDPINLDQEDANEILSSPFILGFNAQVGAPQARQMTKLETDLNFDMYSGPQILKHVNDFKVASPMEQDDCSLALVLIEIACWQGLDNILDVYHRAVTMDTEFRDHQALEKATEIIRSDGSLDRVAHSMGDRYKRVVRILLNCIKKIASEGEEAYLDELEEAVPALREVRV